MDWFGCTKNRAIIRRLESEFAELTRRIAELKRRLHVGEAQPPERIMWSETHGFHDYNDCGQCLEYTCAAGVIGDALECCRTQANLDWTRSDVLETLRRLPLPNLFERMLLCILEATRG